MRNHASTSGNTPSPKTKALFTQLWHNRTCDNMSQPRKYLYIDQSFIEINDYYIQQEHYHQIKLNIKDVFVEIIRTGCLISWLVDLNKNLRVLLVIQLLKIEWQKWAWNVIWTNEEQVRASCNCGKISFTRYKIRPYFIIGWLKQRCQNNFTHLTLKFD